jgi:hypothetical protein
MTAPVGDRNRRDPSGRPNTAAGATVAFGRRHQVGAEGVAHTPFVAAGGAIFPKRSLRGWLGRVPYR